MGSRTPAIFRPGNVDAPLVRILLWEGRPDDAWHEAQKGGCADGLWLDLARERESDHPEDALTVYTPRIGPMVAAATGDYSEPVRFLGKGGTAVEKVELISQNSRGEVESSIAGDGIISFPDYPDKKSVVVKESDGLSVADFAGMSITTLAFDPQRGLLQVRLEGKAGKVRLRSGTAFTDHRVTLLDWLRHSPYLEGLYFLFVAVLSGLLKGLHVEELWHRARHAWVKPA